jgi:hypothetical protein
MTTDKMLDWVIDMNNLDADRRDAEKAYEPLKEEEFVTHWMPLPPAPGKREE